MKSELKKYYGGYVDKLNIHRMILNLYMDMNYVSEITLKKLIESNDNVFISELCSKLYSVIIRTADLEGYESICFDIDKYLTRVNLDELFYRNGKDETNWLAIKGVLKNIPREVLNFFNVEYSNKGVEYIIQNSLENLYTLPSYRNYRDNILFFNDLNSLDHTIRIWCDEKEGEISKEDAAKILSLQIRLTIPRHIYNIILRNCQINHQRTLPILYRNERNHIQFSNYYVQDDLREKEVSELENINNKIKIFTNNGTIHRDQLPSSTMYNIYLNITLEELRELITNVADIEDGYQEQVIGGIYYNLFNYPGIKALLDISEDVERRIEARMNRRVGN